MLFDKSEPTAPTFRIWIYLRSGQTIVADEVEQFKLERGSVSRLTWRQSGKQKVTLDSCNPEDVVAFTSERT